MYEQQSTHQLWDNPATKAALQSMDPKDVAKYKKFGEHMYGSIDYNKNQSVDTKSPVDEAIFYIIEGVKSGLHPSMLDDSEKELLLKIKGDKWWETYGYVKDDLDDIVTLGINK